MSRGNVTKRELCVKRMREIHELSMLAADNVNQRLNFLVRYPIVTKLVEDFEAAHLKIIQNASDEEFETEDSIRRDFDEMRFAVIGRYERFVGADRIAAPAPQAPAQTSSVKLPKISLPQFSGDFTLWPSFIALYNISIHENRNVPTIEKYQYLISCLKGEALNVVKNIPLSADNYAIAYDALISRYQNKRDLADYHVDLMLKAQPLKSESAVLLRTLLSTFTENTRALNLLGFPTDAWDYLLLKFLLEKLPRSLREKFESEHRAEEIPKFTQLTKFLSDHCRVLASVSGSQNTSQKSQSTSSKNSASASSLATRTAECPNSGSANAPTDAEPPSESGTTSSQGSEPLVSMASVARSNPIVLLSTVQAEALDAHGNPFPVRILLDNASQLNFISESCMQRGGFGRTKCHTVVLADLNGVSLNDVLRSGPKLQTDIVVILLRFRVGRVALTADVKQMFLRILVERGQCDYQRIVWRFSENDPILDYLMLTVTFGLTCSPFLAIACLLKLATEGKVGYPLAAAVLEESVYVDDVVASAESEGEARELQRQLQALLKTAGFGLRKWASSHPSVLAGLDPELCSQSLLSFESLEDQFLKVLGLRWYPQTDNFGFQVHLLDRDCTKRTILSELARIFDPLGFLTPLTFAAKRLIQQLWVLKLEWDDRPPSEVCSQWGRYKSELPALASIRIPRTIAMANVIRREIHGFCDASEQGYGAVVYIRIVAEDGVLIRMLSAKSKVAPLKAITLPRLELCAAVLLSDLAEYIGNILRPKITIDEDRDRLKRNQNCSKPLRQLAPFVDARGVLRVGGRLTHSAISHEAKHPALLPGKHRLTELIVERTHRLHLHPGRRALHYLLLQHFWILEAHQAIKRCLSRCYQCFRANPRTLQPPMADLPLDRVRQAKPFSIAGVDYAGPFFVYNRRSRGATPFKAYVCIFICFTTKAVHLELAFSLSTDSFLSALRRFIARRGRCSRIYSDCGTNFVGAQRELVSCMEAASGRKQIQWSFNPPSAPHFGGLWEAGVKATKTHLKRVVGAQILTVEEFSTLLAQVESILNSRPLCPTSSDPHDLGVLSPGHFITLEPLVAVPYPDLDPVPIGRLDRWQLVQHMHQQFWKRWHEEYLHTLQQRPKWLKPADAILKGTLVLLKTENASPLAWRRGRVEELHPGRDGVARVATVRTADGLLSRPLVKLCPLPMDGSPEGLAQT
ncbi:uncharacterized protein LOC143895662 [Temnothorax americanus]|uniref:uncharacterized protein LOC143895662 n=1 Tax=Temnothorax americanus TaxID=1964332 RepID=UPI004068B09C